MPLDTRIALGAQPIQLENPLAQYGQFMGAIHAGTQNQLAMQQVSAIQRAAEEEAGAKGYLSGGVDLSTPEGQRGLLAFGKTGLAYQKAIAEQNKAKLESDKTAAEVLGLSHKNFNTANSPLAASANGIPGITAYVEALYQDPLLGPMAAKIKPKDQALKENLALYAESPEKWTLAHANLDGQHLLEALKTAEARRVETEAAKLRPGYVDPNAPKPVAAALPQVTPTAPVNNMRAEFLPVPNERNVNALDLGVGGAAYRVDGQEVPFAAYADAVRARNQAQGANAAIATTPDMTPAAATAPAVAPAAATAPAVAPAAVGQPDVLNNLKVKIQGLEDYRNKLLPNIGKSAALKSEWEDLGKQIDNLSKGFSVAPGGAYYQPGVGMIERPAAEPTSADVTTMKALGYPITPEGFKAYQDAKRQEKAASEFEQLLEASGMSEDQKKAARVERIKKESTFAPPMQITMPVAIQDPKDPTKVIYVDRSQAIGQTPAAEVPKPLTAVQTQKLKAEKAADTAHVTASQSTASELEKLTNELVGSEDGRIKPHPGLGGITGYAAYLPSLPKGDARQAQQKLDTFKGKILALGREMASQNGKLGNMAVQEWKFVSDAVQALDPKAGNLDQQMRDVVRQAQAFAKNQKSKFESTYEDTGTAGGGVDRSNPLLGD